MSVIRCRDCHRALIRGSSDFLAETQRMSRRVLAKACLIALMVCSMAGWIYLLTKAAFWAIGVI
jgi:hypothetical protein